MTQVADKDKAAAEEPNRSKNNDISDKKVIEEEPESEYIESDELQKKRLPYIYDLEQNKRPVVKSKNPDIEIYDYLIYDALEGKRVIWTSAVIIMFPLCQGRPFTPEDGDIKYLVVEGKGHLLSSDLRKIITKNNFMVVEKGVRHNIINNEEDQKLVISVDYPGFIDFRDIYKPLSQKKKEAEASQQELFKGYRKPEEAAKENYDKQFGDKFL